MTRRRAYLDYNATAPVWPEAAQAAGEALCALGNPSAVHGFGRAVRQVVETAREKVAALTGARPAQIIFTSGGTEANNLALRGLGESGAIARIVISAIEHPSVREAALATGLPVEIAPVTRHGALDLEALPARIGSQGKRTLVSVMSANNETGVIQPLAEVVAMAHEAGAFVHVDAVQSAGRMALSFRELGADLMTLSAHKLGGPAGAGALVVADHVPLAAQLKGGGQERRRRAGTENAAGIAGFGVAVEKAPAIRAAQPRIEAQRDRLERGILALVPDAVFFGAGARRLANTACFATPGLSASLQLMALDLAGVAVSAGAACSSGKIEPSPVLLAMGAGAAAGEAIRVSLGWNTNDDEIDLFLEAFGALVSRRGAPVLQAARA